MSYVIKSADQTKSSDISSVVDSELVLSVASGLTYFVDSMIYWNSGATPDIKIGIGCTAAVGLSGIIADGANSQAIYQNAALGYSVIQAARLTSAGTYVLQGSATASDRGWARFKGVFNTSGAGNIGIYWAQNTSNASNTIVQAGSWIRLEILA